jgi:hypothetical protein
MARDIVWKDLFYLSRYRNHLCILDNVQELVHNPGLILNGLSSLSNPTTGYCTAVSPVIDDLFPFVLGQACNPPNSPSAKLVSLAPKNLVSLPECNDVITRLVTKVGERGAFQILAEVGVDQPVGDVLNQAGFKEYAHQQIWKLPRTVEGENGKGRWFPASLREQSLIEELYQRNIPGSVQRLEHTPEITKEKVLACWFEEKMAGIAITRFGPDGILVDLIMDSDPDEIDPYLASLLFHLPYRNNRDVYFRVRSYQERIGSALERLGAIPGPQQRAVVKKLAVHYNAKQTFRVQRFKEQPDITTPISQSKIKN